MSNDFLIRDVPVRLSFFDFSLIDNELLAKLSARINIPHPVSYTGRQRHTD